MIIAHRHDHSAFCAGAGHIDVAHHIPRTIDPGPLTIPKPEYTVIKAFAAQFRLLRAPKRCCSKILVKTFLKRNIGPVQSLSSPFHLKINSAQRRAAIPCYIARCIPTLRLITRALRDHQANQSLRAVQKHLMFGNIKFIVQRNIKSSHSVPSQACLWFRNSIY